MSIKVLLRCRPFNERELLNNAPLIVTCNESARTVSVSVAAKQVDRSFTFDEVFGPNAQQGDLYDQAVIPIVNEVLEGFNCTIFAYGQTGTGKTYTMEGDCKRSKGVPSEELPRGSGVIPRAVKQIFDTLEGQNAKYSVKVTFLELYNEEITDLLALDDHEKQYTVMEDRKGGVIVGGLQEETVGNSKDIFSLLERGSTKRRSAQTILHSQSSRSHSLFSIKIHIKEATLEGKEKVGKLNLVDLAGSENIFRSGATEGRAREAGEINKSLLTLTRVIKALVNHSPHVPYRDSKLTRLLRDSLGGKTKTCIIATVSPAVLCLEQTLSTLDYAEQARNIKNKPEVNQKMMKASSHFPPSQTSKLLEKTQEVCVLTADMEKSEKAALDLKKKVVDSMAVFVSYIEGVQNIVRLHSAGGSAALDELSALASSISLPIGEILGAEDANMNSLFDDLQQSLSSHQGEVFDLVKEFRQSLNASMEHAINISNSLLGFIEKLSEEQSRTDAQKLNADVTILVSDCMGRQREMTPLQPTASPLQPTASPLQPTASPHRRGFHIRTPVKIRRLKRRWSKEEEEGLRIGVSEYETRWGTILQTYPDIFVGRTQCDLKDKWRNMMKKKK